MKTTVEPLSPTRVKLAVEITFDELKPAFDAAYKKIGAEVRIPGFRPGKVPARILEQRLGRPAILEEVVNNAVPRAYGEALQENDVRALGQPEIEVTRLEDGDTIAFTAEVDVRPTIEVPDLDSLAVTVDPVEVTDDDIDAQISGLRDRFSMLSGVDRSAATGDYVSLDLSATVGGEAVEGGTTTGLSYEVGAGDLMVGLDETLVGMDEAETRTFQTQLVAGDRAGQTADVEITVRSVKEKQLPELDDEFASTASEFDTLDELRADIRERLTKTKKLQQGAEARDKLVEHLINATEVPVPETLVTGELDWRRQAMSAELEEAGMTLETYLETQDTSVEDYEKELRDSVEQAVRTQFLLDAIADQREIGIENDDLVGYIMSRAQRMGVSPDEYAKQISSAGQLPGAVAEIRRSKALANLLQSTIVTDTAGEVVDLSSFLGKGSADGAEHVHDHEEDDHDQDEHEEDSAGGSLSEPATEESPKN
ncbi:MAG: trigger factor [Geodermatophilaceae bacterium]|nr:trigger factor [Geodermatophilaceae bacterium]